MTSDRQRRVLMLLYWFPPSNEVGSYRALKFIKNLAAFNWYPVVIAPSNGVYYSYDYNAEANIKDKCTIYRVPMFYPFGFLGPLPFGFAKKLRQMIWRIWNRVAVPDGAISWVLTSLMAVKRIIRDHQIEVVFATGNPFSVFILGAVIRRAFKGKVKLVIDYRDPWTLNPFTKHSKIRTMAERILERFVLQHADAAIFVTDELREFQHRGFREDMTPEKLYSITNSYEETNDQSICRYDGFVLVHAGNFYGNRGPEKFLEGLSIARKRAPILGEQTHVFFYGLYDEKKLRIAVDKYGLDGMVSYKGRIPQSELLPILKGATVLLLINSYGPGHHVFLPAKFFDYLKANRPILCLAEDGALSRVVRETKAGVVVGPEDVDGIADAILNLHDHYYVKDKEFILNNAETKKFTSAYTTKQLADIFNKVCIS